MGYSQILNKQKNCMMIKYIDPFECDMYFNPSEEKKALVSHYFGFQLLHVQNILCRTPHATSLSLSYTLPHQISVYTNLMKRRSFSQFTPFDKRILVLVSFLLRSLYFFYALIPLISLFSLILCFSVY